MRLLRERTCSERVEVWMRWLNLRMGFPDGVVRKMIPLITNIIAKAPLGLLYPSPPSIPPTIHPHLGRTRPTASILILILIHIHIRSIPRHAVHHSRFIRRSSSSSSGNPSRPIEQCHRIFSPVRRGGDVGGGHGDVGKRREVRRVRRWLMGVDA